MSQDIKLYKELVNFCNENLALIDCKFERSVLFTDFHEACFKEMYLNIQDEPNPIAPKILKERVEGLTECYKTEVSKFLFKRNSFKKGLDIQLGQWYEKAFQLFLESKGIIVNKKGFPFPDFEVIKDNEVVAYYELKYIEAPFVSANTQIKNTYPYTDKRYDYECSLTLDTGRKLMEQREKIEQDLSSVPTYYVWWFDAPHLKGIFFMDSKEVFNYWDNVGDLHERNTREGDLESKQVTTKIYPPLLKMKSLENLIQTFK
ncbi:hypothetical protein HX014_15680 [Myroides marinus]|uniref:hypothetical protein n=1 Tax=Myroides marinus TaxID=703342 RepID=UPI0025772B85|nr:hypothetical protein [Myroides marinus]MDM1352076.1 hypothetical protein [Myroides marinus]MDM1359238.1 hypothetical protein [Myroides marinus]